MSHFTFPNDFVWGTATSAYQIEGAHEADGRGLSVWDTFCRQPGRVYENHTGDTACDHYRLYREDVALMRELNLNAYRFSLSWPRIMPEGQGTVNRKGVDFYSRLIDCLLEAGITPFLTVFHWDLPQALEDKYGGWRNKEVSRLFADYAGKVSSLFADRVRFWTTTNEIGCFTRLAYRSALSFPAYRPRRIVPVKAPGVIESEKTINQAIHNGLYGHGLAVQAIRAAAQGPVQVGLVEDTPMVWPVYDTPEHREAAKKAWAWENRQILFPLMTGEYSDELREELGDDMPDYTEEEMKVISLPIDYIGYNFYQGQAVRALPESGEYEFVPFPRDFPKTSMDWPITPRGPYFALRFSSEVFPDLPVYITENGCAYFDTETMDGEILDIDRVEYLRMHLEMLSRSVNEGSNLKGYFLWSLMDNFEWELGYSMRFGLVRVNYATQKRTVKLSGRYYADVIRQNRVL